MISREFFRKFNFLLIIQIIPLLVISSILLYEMDYALFIKQMIYYFISISIFIIILLIPIKRYTWLIPIIYWLSLVILFLVEIIGKTINGAKRWLEIPLINLTIQPSEFIKITVLLMLAYLISKNPPKYHGYSFIFFLKSSFFIAIPAILILREPDLGTALALFGTGLGVLFLIGIQKKIWIILVIFMVTLLPIYYQYIMRDYQKQRISNFLGKPSYQSRQALIAIGSGGAYGKNENDATQTKLNFLPVSTTDFIFAYLGERFGFIGMISTIILYIFFIYHLLAIAKEENHNYFIKVFSIGIAFLCFIYTSVNILMIIGFAPVVGLPLPMFSHGGSSFLLFIILIAILENFLIYKTD